MNHHFLEHNQRQRLDRGHDRSLRDTRNGVHHRKEYRKAEAHPYQCRVPESSRPTWVRKDGFKEIIHHDLRHDLVKEKSLSHHSANKSQLPKHTESDTDLSKSTPREENGNEREVKTAHSEEVQSHHCEIPKPQPVTDTGNEICTDELHQTVPMEEDRMWEDQPMLEKPTNHMLDVSYEEFVEENGDNDELLDDEELLGEDSKWLGMTTTNQQRTSSTSRENSLNETMMALKAKVKSKPPKSHMEHPTAKQKPSLRKMAKGMVPHGVYNKKTEIFRRGSLKRCAPSINPMMDSEDEPSHPIPSQDINSKGNAIPRSSSHTPSGSVVFQKPSRPSI